MGVRSAKALCLAAMLVLLAAVPALGKAGPLPGVLPSDSSLLFALNGKSGSLDPAAKAKRDDRFVLTLRGLGRDTTWFADRPERDAGLLSTAKLFSGWAQLGFRQDPPNAALVVKGKDGRHTMAVELKLRHYDAAARSARFDVRALGSLGGGLDHLNQKLESRLPRRFLAPSLFIDNGEWELSCDVGQPQLMAVAPGTAVVNRIPADGRTLSIDRYQAIYSLYGNTFGGSLAAGTFALPKMTAPPGAAWYVCNEGEGYYPSTSALTSECKVGEIDYWIFQFTATDPKWLPADGRTLTTTAYPEYGAAYAGSAPSFTLPKVSPPPGMQALVCVESSSSPEPLLGELDLFPGTPPGGPAKWEPAAGEEISPGKNPGLATLLSADTASGGKVPNVSAPVAGTGYFISASGSWPLR